MQVGIVGLGIVGTANRIGFEQLGHDVKCHDIKFKTNIDIVKDTEAIFICVPTPSHVMVAVIQQLLKVLLMTLMN